MSRFFAVVEIVAVLTAPMAIATSARANDDGRVAARIAGGALGGLFLGGLLAQQPPTGTPVGGLTEKASDDLHRVLRAPAGRAGCSAVHAEVPRRRSLAGGDVRTGHSFSR
jgi:hypothetical protein